MSRDVGGTLDERLVAHVRDGAPVVLTWVEDSSPRCAFGRGLAAGEDEVEVEVFTPVPEAGAVAIHTLGPPVCMIRGTAGAGEPAGERPQRVRVRVDHVKDDRPPGLAIEPMRFAGEGPRP
jgi:hypothetical protein